MGDRTWARIHCRPEDAEGIEELLGMEVEEAFDGHVELYSGEMTPDFSELPGDKPWIYNHGEGADYGCFEGVCDGSASSEWPQGHDGGYVVSNFGAPGWDDERLRLEQHIRIEKAARAALAIER